MIAQAAVKGEKREDYMDAGIVVFVVDGRLQQSCGRLERGGTEPGRVSH